MPPLTLLLPAGERFAGMALPATLSMALGRADIVAGASGEKVQLLRHFRLLPDRWSPAALARVADAGIDDARQGAWLRADPAHIRPDINGARLLATGSALSMEAEDIAAFLPALRPLFGDTGFLLDAPHPARWYLRLPRDAQLPAFAEPIDALGEDVFDHSPDGPLARRWRSLLSEAQVILHNHPRNQVRADAGRVPVNSLWFWGAGTVPDNVTSGFPSIFSDDPVLHGLARVGNVTAMPLADFEKHDTAGFEEALVDLRAVRDPGQVLERWLLPAHALAAREGVDLKLDLADGTLFHMVPGQRWRFWRRPRTTLAR